MFSRQGAKRFLTVPGQTHPGRLCSRAKPERAAEPGTARGGQGPRAPRGGLVPSRLPLARLQGPEEDEQGPNLGSGLVCLKAQLPLQTASPAG